jgi:hypothetical protein
MLGNPCHVVRKYGKSFSGIERSKVPPCVSLKIPMIRLLTFWLVIFNFYSSLYGNFKPSNHTISTTSILFLILLNPVTSRVCKVTILLNLPSSCLTSTKQEAKALSSLNSKSSGTHGNSLSHSPE